MDTVIIKCIFCIEYICKLWPMWTAVVKCRWTLLYLRGYCHTFTLPKTLEVIAYINSTGSLLHQAQGQWSWLPPCTFQIFIFSKKYWIKKLTPFVWFFSLSFFTGANKWGSHCEKPITKSTAVKVKMSFSYSCTTLNTPDFRSYAGLVPVNSWMGDCLRMELL